MPRRIGRTKPSVFSPAGELLRKLGQADQKERWQQVGLAAIGAVVLFLYATFAGPTGVPNIVRLELEKRHLINANRARFAELVDATYEIDRLRSDKPYLEFIARTRYRMVFPNEILYRIKEQ